MRPRAPPSRSSTPLWVERGLKQTADHAVMSEQLSSPVTAFYKVMYAVCGGVLGIGLFENIREATASLWAWLVLVPWVAFLVRMRGWAHVTLLDSCLVVKVHGRQVH